MKWRAEALFGAFSELSLRVPGKVSGAWVLKGTFVPVKALFDNLEDDARADEFLEWFPGVFPGAGGTVLEFAGRSLIEV